MKRKTLTTLFLLGLLAIVAGGCADSAEPLAEVRAATERFQQTEAAQAAGWDLVPDLDHCFDNPGTGAMGYHYINTDLLDTELDPLQPEAMVYEPLPDGQMKLGAVEYVVPAAAWDEAGNGELPMPHDRHFHLNEDLGVYVLHAWIWKDNPAGLFEDWNPDVSCT
jgi:hypothetical protein